MKISVVNFVVKDLKSKVLVDIVFVIQFFLVDSRILRFWSFKFYLVFLQGEKVHKYNKIRNEELGMRIFFRGRDSGTGFGDEFRGWVSGTGVLMRISVFRNS